MLFNIFNIEKYSESEVLLHGKLVSENYTTIKTVRVKNIVSPVYILPSHGCQTQLINDLTKFTKEIHNIEHVERHNMFYKSMDISVNLIKVHLLRKVSFENFDSEFCEFISTEFSSPVENIIITKTLRGPCQIEISTAIPSKQGITIDCTNNIIPTEKLPAVVDYNAIKFVGSCNLGHLKIASLTFKSKNADIESFVYFDFKNTISGALENSNTPQNKPHVFYKNSMDLVSNLNKLLATEDPDVVVFHNFHLRNKLKIKNKIICDLYDFACGNVKGKDFSIQELAMQYDIVVEPGIYGDSKAIYELFNRMQALNLAKEMAEISGYLLNKCLENSRSERIEYTLLNELYARGYLFPPNTYKPVEKYTGGLVLDPISGFYDEFVLLLDFNSLYPSIIQEFDVCFSTIGLCECDLKDSVSTMAGCMYCRPNTKREENYCVTNPMCIQQNDIKVSLKTTPEDNPGAFCDNFYDNANFADEITKKICHKKSESIIFLPKILSNLVKRRKTIKDLIKNTVNAEEKAVLNIRQQAIKLTANSIYGCLGSPISRFCNYKMAAFITAKGRELLTDAKHIATGLGMRVIYGDTDSIMIYTSYPGRDENYSVAINSASTLVSHINKKYRFIEIETEKAFKKLILYTKKKYGALVYDPKGSYVEYKGLDLLRRDFCKASSNLCKNVLNIILENEEVMEKNGPGGNNTSICQPNNNTMASKESLAQKVYQLCRECVESLGSLSLDNFIIYSSLSKDLSAYNAQLAQPHVTLALRLQKDKGLVFKQNDVIPYCIGSGSGPIHQRSFHPDENFTIDLDFYLKNQILPSLSRIISLCPYLHNEKIGQIFGHKCVVSRPVLKSVTFMTECCDTVQSAGLYCIKCNKAIPHEFYVRKVQELIQERCNRLYNTYGQCLECNTYYYNHLQSCVQCAKPLEFRFGKPGF